MREWNFGVPEKGDEKWEFEYVTIDDYVFNKIKILRTKIKLLNFSSHLSIKSSKDTDKKWLRMCLS